MAGFQMVSIRQFGFGPIAVVVGGEHAWYDWRWGKLLKIRGRLYEVISAGPSQDDERVIDVVVRWVTKEYALTRGF